ncbi:1213_t:CDS:2 [Cetraspora pellucida]|uniref:1213_t:CDS:1 n=1 Tax=Cetraspora pellucida TaxID=1433469 RepID=A0ACA9MBF1_9GLOM|nr:1213_t:CDS:2 [Cetraspora pellucida]
MLFASGAVPWSHHRLMQLLEVVLKSLHWVFRFVDAVSLNCLMLIPFVKSSSYIGALFVCW